MSIRRLLPLFLLILLAPAFLLYGAGQNVLFDDFDALTNWSYTENPSGALSVTTSWAWVGSSTTYGNYEANLTWIGSSFSLQAFNATAYFHVAMDSSYQDGYACLVLLDSAGNSYAICLNASSAPNAQIHAFKNDVLIDYTCLLYTSPSPRDRG